VSVKTLLITPPFTQLNTPYPATAYLKGFLDSKEVVSVQYDLSIALFNKVFTSSFFSQIFKEADEFGNSEFPLVGKQRVLYIERIDVVTSFLRNQDIITAKEILVEGYLPKGHRRELDLDTAYHNLDEIDQAKHLGTIFIEELGDFITANVDEFFSFTRYAEQISSSASSFDQLAEYLSYSTTLIEDQLLLLLVNKIEEEQPGLICFTIPFPGNLFAALRCGQFIKKNYKHIKVAFGGGYCNTELRSLTDPRIFKFIDYITLDDGEGPVLRLIQYLNKEIEQSELERTFLLKKKKVFFQNKIPNTIFHHKDLPAPSYNGLDFKRYMSFLDVINPMHRLWTDGKWNKLTVSHGCYWKQCTFCDVNLDYIGNYQNTTAIDFVDKVEKVMGETNNSGFHFVDEAAPPKMLKAIAEELLLRKLNISWWTNIRFEKTFTDELCELLAKSGCIAVTGGLEVASDRLLTKMKKGVDIAQVARVTNSFSKYGIMTHAYLMYGFPTETEQETIDSLDVVRQLFENNCIQSAFWHQFTTTIHSPIGKNPEAFDIKITGPKFKGFAQNDLTHKDPKGAEHQIYTKGLNKALNSYLNGNGFDIEIGEWFDFKTLPTLVNKTLIQESLV
jgi:tRNA A37 methylthiotransferase MiaB